METEAPAQIKLIFEYTKFHIGLYASLIAVLMGLMKLGAQKIPPELVIAGAAGGVIASSISVDYRLVAEGKGVGPFGLTCLSSIWWAHVEHLAFWLGILISVMAFLLTGSAAVTPVGSPSGGTLVSRVSGSQPSGQPSGERR
jgi:hypothetical protein